MQRRRAQDALAGIVCHVCNGTDWRTRYARRLVDHIERRRECLQCGLRLTTEERQRDISDMRVHNANNPKQPLKPKPKIKRDNVTIDVTTKERGNSRLYIEEPARLPQPTDAQPGSHEKIELLRQRVARGEHLFHPLDRTTAPEPSKDIRQDCTSLCELVA